PIAKLPCASATTSSRLHLRELANYRKAEIENEHSAGGPLFAGVWIRIPTWIQGHPQLSDRSRTSNHLPTTARWAHRLCRPSCDPQPHRQSSSACGNREALNQ